MAELATIARPYADALFQVAQSGNLAQWSDMVAELAQLGSHPEVRTFITNPKLTNQQVLEAFESLFRSKPSAEVSNFLALLVENGRLVLLPEIAQQFQALKNAAEGAADAHIASAFELSSAQLQELVATLEKKFERKLKPFVTIDPALIGGVRVAIGDQVLDTSVRAKLQHLHNALAA